jgi:hypothetical protein
VFRLGCPRNKQIFFWFEPKQTETQPVSVVFRFVLRNQRLIFSVFFGLFQCFETVLKQPKQTETNRKNENKKNNGTEMLRNQTLLKKLFEKK